LKEHISQTRSEPRAECFSLLEHLNLLRFRQKLQDLMLCLWPRSDWGSRCTCRRGL